LSLIPAGGYCPEAARALAQGKLQSFFAELRAQFDCIVLDTSPLLAVSDALLVGTCADGVVLSIRPGVSEAHQVHAAYERLQELGLPFVGAVVSGTTDRSAYDDYDYPGPAGD
jgi:receptor protein-tyrosine kinase